MKDTDFIVRVFIQSSNLLSHKCNNNAELNNK
jgi:hypothetical protein